MSVWKVYEIVEWDAKGLTMCREVFRPGAEAGDQERAHHQAAKMLKVIAECGEEWFREVIRARLKEVRALEVKS